MRSSMNDRVTFFQLRWRRIDRKRNRERERITVLTLMSPSWWDKKLEAIPALFIAPVLSYPALGPFAWVMTAIFIIRLRLLLPFLTVNQPTFSYLWLVGVDPWKLFLPGNGGNGVPFQNRTKKREKEGGNSNWYTHRSKLIRRQSSFERRHFEIAQGTSTTRSLTIEVKRFSRISSYYW